MNAIRGLYWAAQRVFFCKIITPPRGAVAYIGPSSGYLNGEREEKLEGWEEKKEVVDFDLQTGRGTDEKKARKKRKSRRYDRERERGALAEQLNAQS